MEELLKAFKGCGAGDYTEKKNKIRNAYADGLLSIAFALLNLQCQLLLIESSPAGQAKKTGWIRKAAAEGCAAKI